MDERGYWNNYLLGSSLGFPLEGRFTSNVDFSFLLPEELSHWCKGNLNNGKLLLISIIREVFQENDLIICLGIRHGAHCFPIDVRGEGDFRSGAKKLLGEFRNHLVYMDSFLPFESSGLVISDSSSTSRGKDTMEFIVSEDLRSIHVCCKVELEKFVRALSKLIVAEIKSEEIFDQLEFKRELAEVRSSSIQQAAKRKILIEEIWKSVFQEKIQWEKNYYANGGDSIQAIRLLSKLKEEGAVIDLSGLLNCFSLEYWTFNIQEHAALSKQVDLVIPSRYPLSEMQQKIWSHYQSFKEHGAYHEQFLFELKRYPGADIIHECISAIWKSYGHLRVKIIDSEGATFQEISNTPVCFVTKSFQSIDEALCDDRSKHFDDSFLRVSLININKSNYLLWSHHHLILDGWSVGILIQEFVRRISEKDFSVVQQPNYQYQLVQFENERTEYHTNPIVFEPYIFPVLEYHQEATFETLSFENLKIDSSREKELLENLQVTRQLLCCGITGLLLGSIRGEDSFYFNGISAGRDFLEGDIDKAVGLFIQNLQIKVSFEKLSSWKSYYLQLKDYFQESLLKSSHLKMTEEDVSNSDFLFVYENYPYEHLKSDDFEAELIQVTEITGYPVTFCMFPAENGYALRIVYDARRFNQEFVLGLKLKFEQLYGVLMNAHLDSNIYQNEKERKKGVPNALALDTLSIDDFEYIGNRKLKIECLSGLLWNDLFEGVRLTKSPDKNIRSGLQFWNDQLFSGLSGFWTDNFIKEDFSKDSADKLIIGVDKILMVVFLAQFLRRSIWKYSGFQFICGKNGILFPLIIEELSTDDEINRIVEQQFELIGRHEKVFNDLLRNEWIPGSNILILLDEVSVEQESNNFDLIISRKGNDWKVSHSKAISASFVEQLTTVQLGNINHENSLEDLSIVFPDKIDKLDLRHFMDQFEYHSISIPDFSAVDDGVNQYSYSELNTYAQKIASWIESDYSLKDEKYIGVALERGADQLAVVLAILKLGRAFVPLDNQWPKQRIDLIRNQAGLKLIIDTEMFRKVDFNSGSTNTIIHSRVLDAPAYVLFTSGSTGVPKGCEISHGALANYLKHCETEYFDEAYKTRVHVFSPLTFDFTLTSYLGGLANGLTIVLHNETKNVYDSLRESLEDDNCHFLKLTPSHIQLGEREWFVSANKMKLVVGGEPLNSSHIEKCKQGTEHIVINEYGPTEAAVGCVVEQVELDASPFIGYPIKGMGVIVLDEHSQPVRKGCEGELFLFGENLAIGYLNDLSLTASSFIYGLTQQIDRVYKTGDLVKMQFDGRLLYVSRKDQQIKLNGYRIETEEIRFVIKDEFDLDSHTIFVELNGSKQLVSFFEGEIEKLDFRAVLRGKLPAYMVPSAFFSVPIFPLTSNGKLDTKDLLNHYLSSLQKKKGGIHNPVKFDLQKALSYWLRASDEVRELFTNAHIINYGWDKTSHQIAFIEELLFKKVNNLFPQSIEKQLTELFPNDPKVVYVEGEASFLTSKGLEITKNEIVSLANFLKERDISLPENYGKLISKTINGLNSPMNEPKQIDIIELQFLNVNEIAVVRDFSESLDFPVLVEKKTDGKVVWLTCPKSELNIRDVFGYEQPIGWSGSINNLSENSFFCQSVGGDVQLPDNKYIDRFSHKINLGFIESMIYNNFDGIYCAFVFIFNSRIYLFIKPSEGFKANEFKSKLADILPIWCQPDEISISDDISKAVSELQMNSSNVPKGSFENFVTKNISEYAYLRGDYSLIEQGGDSITALRIIGKLKTKGFHAEIGDLLNADKLDDFFGQIKRMSNTVIESDAKQLTPIQNWFFEEYKGNKNHYNQSILLEVLLPVESIQLLAALEKTLSNYSILSKVYLNGWKPGIKPTFKLIQCQTEEEITKHCSDIQCSFNIAVGPVAGGAIFQMKDQLFLFVALHHLYCDGYTWRIILDELQNVLQGSANAYSSSDVFGKTRRRFMDLAIENSTSSDAFYGNTIQDPFKGWSNFTFESSNYLEWEWSIDETRWFQFSDEIGKTANERFLFLFVKTWIEIGYSSTTIFFETHGRSYTGIPELSETLGWFTQFFPVFTTSWPKLETLSIEIAQQFSELPANGLTYMALDDWHKPPFPVLLNYLGNFDEDRGALAIPSSISQGNMTDPSNPALSVVEVNSMIMEGKMKWMIRVHPDLDPAPFRDTLNTFVSSMISGKIAPDYIAGSIDQDDLDAIGDIIGG